MPYKKSSSRKIIYIFLGVIFIGGICFFLKEYYFPVRLDYNSLSSKLDAQINQELFKLGVEDKDIIKYFQQEEQEGQIKWIKVTKELTVPASVFLVTYQKKLEEIIKNNNLQIINSTLDNTKNILKIAAGKNNIVLQEIILYPRETKKYLVAIVIDDVGYNKEQVEKFIKLNIPLTFSILPGEIYSRELANKLSSLNYETILHLPLEPQEKDLIKDKEKFILVETSPEEMHRKLEIFLKEIGKVKGANNHMGSLFTQNEKKMKELLSIFKEKNFYFLDSFTIPNSCALEVANYLGVPAIRRDVFLDNQDDLEYILNQLDELKKIVLNQGYAIGIGHVQKENTPIAISKKIKEFQEAGINFVPLNYIVFSSRTSF